MSANCVFEKIWWRKVDFLKQEDVESCPALLPTTSASLICYLNLYSAKVLVASQKRDSAAK